MNILCNTKEELEKVLKKLENNGYNWRSGDPVFKWGMDNINLPAVIIMEKTVTWDFDVYDYEDSVTAAQFIGDADLNTEKESEPIAEILVDKAEYDKAVIEALAELGSSEELDGLPKLIVPLVGALFAKRVKNRLFKEDKQNGSK